MPSWGDPVPDDLLPQTPPRPPRQPLPPRQSSHTQARKPSGVLPKLSIRNYQPSAQAQQIMDAIAGMAKSQGG